MQNQTSQKMTKKRIRLNNKYWILFILVFILSSCNNNIVYTKYQTFSENEWHSKDSAVFEFDVKDTLSLNNISLMVRHADSYEYRNLFLFVTSKYPNGKVSSDTMEIILSNEKGEWQGSGAGDIFDYKVVIKKNTRLPILGKHLFSFKQGMREDPLPLIMDFGFEIEKVNN